MPPKQIMPPLVGIREFAAILGVPPATLRAYKARGKLPEPLPWPVDHPVWPRDVAVRYAEARPGKGWRGKR